MLSALRYTWISMRPRQWTKNVLIFAGLVFSRNLTDIEFLSKISVGFLLLSFTASSVYIFNDLIDVENDRRHPEKNSRPLASGKLRVSQAYWASAVLLLTGLSGAIALNTTFFFILVSYALINMAYSFKLKQMVILDIGIIAFGFVLRVFAGTTLAGVAASDWLIVCTLMVSLFLGFSKRRQELVLAGDNANNQRKVLEKYSVSFLDQMISVVTACTVMSYSLYTISQETVERFGTKGLVFTIPSVLYGIFRYLYLIYHEGVGENPTDLITRDFPFILNVIVWAGLVIVIIY